MSRMSPGVADPERRAGPGDLLLSEGDRDATFDSHTKLVAMALDVPMAAITLVGEERGFFSSSAGEVARQREAVLGLVHCGQVLDRQAPIVIEDVRRASLPTTPATVVRSCAGVPVLSGGGTARGAVCVMDRIPRRWTSRDLDLLSAAGRMVLREIDQYVTRLRAARRGEGLEQRAGVPGASLARAKAALLATRHELARSRRETIWRLTGAIAARSGETGAHAERMGLTCASLARRIGLEAGLVELIRVASPLHDVGKIAIPDRILGKPGPLDAAERAVVETHAVVGHRMLAGSREPLLELGALIALHHHERMDGRGYPRGVRGRDIPIEGRIAAVADVYDALTNERVYRAAYPVAAALSIMEKGRGTQFDPRVLDALHDDLSEDVAPSRAGEIGPMEHPSGGAG